MTTQQLPAVNSNPPRVRVEASADVQAALDTLARTEDLRFSSDGLRLAIAGYAKNEITLFTVDPQVTDALALTDAVCLQSEALSEPHGLDFLDNDTIVVASRFGWVDVFDLKELRHGAKARSVLQVQKANRWQKLHCPGSVAVVPGADDRILVCNNYLNRLTLHHLDRAKGTAIKNRIVLTKGLQIPDGVTICPQSGTVAVAVHLAHEVFLFDSVANLTPKADPSCRLQRIDYPHGIRFSRDGAWLFVADAGQPFVHGFRKPAEGWHEPLNPAVSLRVMEDAEYVRGRANPTEGGPKGLDIDPSGRFLCVTSEFAPLRVFDLAACLGALADLNV